MKEHKGVIDNVKVFDKPLTSQKREIEYNRTDSFSINTWNGKNTKTRLPRKKKKKLRKLLDKDGWYNMVIEGYGLRHRKTYLDGKRI